MVLDAVRHWYQRLSTVMDVFRSRFYSLNVTLLSMVGLWPYQRIKSWQLFQQVMCQISVTTVMMSQAVRLFEVWGNLDMMIECLTPMGVQLGAVIKSVNCIVQQKEMTKLLEIIKSDWSNLTNEKEIAILMKYAQKGRNLTILYTVFLYTTIFLYLMIPLLPRIFDVIVPLNESRPPVYLYQTQYYVDPEEYFIWILLHTYSGTLVTVTCIIAADSMFACYIMHACGILAVIGHRLRNLTSKSSDTGGDVCVMSKDDDNRYYREIVFCIDQHYRVTQIVKSIESCHSVSYFITICVAMILLSISAVQLLIKLDQVEEVIRLFQFNLAQFNHLLFNSYPAQKLIDEGLNFRESIFAAEWYSLSQRNQNLLRFAMLRTLEPQKITAGKLYIMSLENFGVVIQTSMSYFTVFASIR